jgi:hypothetical protein
MAASWLNNLLPFVGWEFKSTKKKEDSPVPVSPVAPENVDASYTLMSDNFGKVVYPAVFDSAVAAQDDLIRKYRATSQIPEVDTAIGSIVDDAIVTDESSSPVQIVTDDLKTVGVSETTAKKIADEFENILRLLKFNMEGTEIFKKWYVDAMLYYHIIIDPTKSKEGIKELRNISPFDIKKIREVRKEKIENVEIVSGIKEYFQYTPKYDALYGTNSYGFSPYNQVAMNLTKDSVCFVHSGILNEEQNLILGYLHKALRAANMLSGMEDAMVIYRMSRAAERRVFYVDVGNLPKKAADQYLASIANKYRNRAVFDPSSGEIKDKAKVLSMMEDFWLPRRDGSKGTEIETLPGGQNLGDIQDVEYLLKKLYKSLNIPTGRLVENDGFSLGRSSEISREEIAFGKFIAKLRKRFSLLFYNLLRVQLILKGIINADDWDDIAENISFNFMKDSYFEELKEIDVRRERLTSVDQMMPYVGIFYSREYIKKEVLKQTDEEIEEMKAQMEKEKVEEPNPGMAPGETPYDPGIPTIGNQPGVKPPVQPTTSGGINNLTQPVVGATSQDEDNGFIADSRKTKNK